MCGLLGVIQREKTNGLAEQLLKSQQYRGPDFEKLINDKVGKYDVTLGHNRLAILDLDPRSNQPMSDESGLYTITFNGEIYNYKELRKELENSYHYRFTTESDTEVLLKAYIAWGEAAFSKLNGGFAFAILDRKPGKILLCRDRFGKKPLYYYSNSRCFVFASTTKVISQEFSLKPNYDYLARGLKYYAYEDDEGSSQFQDLFQVTPGHYYVLSLVRDEIHLVKERYYDFRKNVALIGSEIASLSESELLKKTKNLLTDAVSIRLRSDVPIGLSLSGGLDSAVIAGLSSQYYTQGGIKAFTFGSAENKKSEYQEARHVAQMHKLDLIEVAPSIDEVREDFDNILAIQGAPFAGASLISQYYVYKAAKRHGIKVMLGGQGADEAFLGYRKFMLYYIQDLRQAKKWREILEQMPWMLLSFLHELPRFKVYFDRLMDYSNKSYDGLLNFHYSDPQFSQRDSLKEAQILDILKFSLPTLLKYEDCNSLGNGVESRLPFVDYRILELGAALPVSLEIKNGYGKYILRKLAHDLVPEGIRWARFKRGFDNSLYKGWIEGGLGSLIRSQISQDFFELYARNKKSSIASFFSNEAFIKERKKFAEAVALIWLQRQVM